MSFIIDVCGRKGGESVNHKKSECVGGHAATTRIICEHDQIKCQHCTPSCTQIKIALDDLDR